MWFVKIPIYGDLEDRSWETIEEFETQEEAIQFVKEEFTADDDGTIQLVYEEV